MKITLISVALVATAAAFSASAQAETFDGPYIGVTAGWERGEIDESIEGSPRDAEVSPDALTLGGCAGYNFRLPSIPYRIGPRVPPGVDADTIGERLCSSYVQP